MPSNTNRVCQQYSALHVHGRARVARQDLSGAAAARRQEAPRPAQPGAAPKRGNYSKAPCVMRVYSTYCTVRGRRLTPVRKSMCACRVSRWPIPNSFAIRHGQFRGSQANFAIQEQLDVRILGVPWDKPRLVHNSTRSPLGPKGPIHSSLATRCGHSGDQGQITTHSQLGLGIRGPRVTEQLI